MRGYRAALPSRQSRPDTPGVDLGSVRECYVRAAAWKFHGPTKFGKWQSNSYTGAGKRRASR